VPASMLVGDEGDTTRMLVMPGNISGSLLA
jgi:hypothetical protein